MAAKAVGQISLVDITDSYTVILTSEAYTFTGTTDGAPIGSTCNTQVVAYCGNTQCSKVTIDQVAMKIPQGIKADIINNGAKEPKITFTTTAVISESCEAEIPVKIDNITVIKKFSFSVAKTGADGGANLQVGGTNLIVSSKVNPKKIYKKGNYLSSNNYYFAVVGITVEPDTEYVLSMPAIIVPQSSPNFYVVEKDNRGMEVETTAKELIHKIRTGSNAVSISISAYSSDGLYKKGYKFEKGNIATDWSPAPEDIEEDITDAKKTATNYMGFNSGSGLIIGDLAGKYTSEEKVDESRLGNNVKIDSASIQMRNGTKVLAEYGARSITLGDNNGKNLYIDSNGIKFYDGNSIIGTYSSNNIQLGKSTDNNLYLDTTSIKLQKNGKVLSEFGESTIYLGKDNKNSVIDLCNGSGVIERWTADPRHGGITIRSDGYADVQGEYGSRLSGPLSAVLADWGKSNRAILYTGFEQGVVDGWHNYILTTEDSVTIGHNGNAIKINMINEDAFFNKYDKGNVKMYYTSYDTIAFDVYSNLGGAIPFVGYITSGGRDVRFTIPLSKPVVGVSNIDVDISGIRCRQNGKYVYSPGSSSSFVVPQDYNISAELIEGNLIAVSVTMDNNTNAINNAPCGVELKGIIYFF